LISLFYVTCSASRVGKTMNGGYYLSSFFLSSHCKLDLSTCMSRIWRSRTIRCLALTLIDSGQCSCVLQAKNGRKYQLVDADKLHFVSSISVCPMQFLDPKNWSDMLRPGTSSYFWELSSLVQISVYFSLSQFCILVGCLV
jgi:hypothetical protein